MLIRAMSSHYRRHPLQLASLALMITVATMLWTGVYALTSQAERSLEFSESSLSTQQQVIREDGQPISIDDFVALRRAGFCVAPWVETQAPSAESESSVATKVIGIDPLALACFGESRPDQGVDSLSGQPFLDISEIAPARGEWTLLIRRDHGDLPTGYRTSDVQGTPSTGELADSFLLNLDALSVLVLLITGLLVRSVYQLGLSQRRSSFELLYRFGVSSSQIQRLLTAELIVLTLICVVPGAILGQWLSSLLGAGFGQALGSLFDVTVYAEGNLVLPWQPVVVMTALVLMVCLADRWLPRRASGLSESIPWLLGCLSVLTLGLAIVWAAASLAWVFIGIALAFVGTGGLTPGVLSRLADWRGCSLSTSDQNGGEEPATLVGWRYRELGVMVRRLALPLVALQFAFASVLAIQALVTTFEDTFKAWLAQRLSAEYYLEVPPGVSNAKTLDTLTAMEGLGDFHLVLRGRADLTVRDGGPPSTSLDLLALTPISKLVTDWTLLAGNAQPWVDLQQTGVLVNEQLALREGLEVGSSVEVQVGSATLERQVVGIYADYGRPSGEMLLPFAALPPGYETRFRSLSVNPGAVPLPQLLAELKQAWGVADLKYRDNGSLKALASEVFSQTFLLTRAISVLTLALASVSLLVMGWVFFTTRGWYFRLLSVWGLPEAMVKRQLRRLSVTLSLTIILAALPLGIWLTWVLVSRINPLAFGWSLPMAVYPQFWIELAALAAVIGWLIALEMGRSLSGAGAGGESEKPGATLLAGGER